MASRYGVLPLSEVRDRMIDGAARLLASRGLEGTSFADVLALTGAPRGSLYHHFPGGKDELVAAAVDRAAALALASLDEKAGAPAIEVAAHFLAIWRAILTRSHLESGCAIVAATVAAQSPALLDRTAAAFRAWRARLAALLAEGGLPEVEAGRFALLLLSASEGAVVLSRAERDIEPFEQVAATLLDQLRAATSSSSIESTRSG